MNDTPLSPIAFTEYVVACLAQMPDISNLSSEELLVELEYQGRKQSVGLDNRYRQYLRAPNPLDEFVKSIYDSIEQTHPDSLPEVNRATVEHIILPQLKPIGFVEGVRAGGAPDLLAMPFAGDLVITFVLDMPQSMMYLNLDHAQQAGLTADEALAWARRNLKARTPDRIIQYHGSGRNALCISAALDGYDATRLLLPDLLDKWAKRVQGRLLLGVPNRDFFVGFGDADREIAASIAAQIRADFRSRDYAVSPLVFEWMGGAVRPRAAGKVH